MKKILLFLLIFVTICSCKTSEKIDCDAYSKNKEIKKKTIQDS